MVALYVTSSEAAAGKTTICAGIGRWLLANGKSVGFLKPVLLTTEPQAADKDAAFIKQILGLTQPAESLCAMTMTPQALDEALDSKGDGLGKKVQKAYAEVSKNKEVAVLEGLSGLGTDNNLTQASHQIVEALDARVIMVIRYSSTLPLEMIASVSERFGKRMLGVIINGVPRSKLEMESSLEREGIKVLGVLPEDRALFTVTVGELAEHLQGTILNCPEGLEQLVENLMVGAMCVDPGPEYFNRKPNKAVITRGERPDMQMAALETSTKCLILSGNIQPIPTVLYYAEDKGVPIISVEQDTLSIIAGVEEALSKARFHQEEKLKRLEQIMGQHFDFQALYEGVGLAY